MARRALPVVLAAACVGVHALPPVRLTPKGSIGAVEEPDDQLPKPDADWEEERESALLARGTTARADFSQVQLTYLGRDRVLSFNQWTGGYELWQFERTRLSQCDALSWPPLSSGRWSSLRYQSFVFIGFTQLFTLDPLRGDVSDGCFEAFGTCSSSLCGAVASARAHCFASEG